MATLLWKLASIGVTSIQMHLQDVRMTISAHLFQRARKHVKLAEEMSLPPHS
jgi:hypothetical protein